MTWQDELRQLDEELAAGRLSAEDYRRQRDELLSQGASTAAPAHQLPHPPANQQSSGPFPPPFRWDQSPSESTQYLSPVRDEPPHGSDSTQVVPGRAAAGDDAERTQVVPGQHGPMGQPGQRPGDGENTQVVPGQHGPMGPSSPPVGFPNQQQPPLNQGPPPPGFNQSVPPWQQQGPGNNPPWGGSDLPPTTDLPPAWLRQGPEVFESTKSSNTGKIMAGAIAVVLVAAVAVAAFFVFRPDDQGASPTNTTTAAPTSTTTTTSAPPEPIVRPAGSVQIDDVFTLDRLRAAQLLSTEDFAIVEVNKVTEVQVAVTKQGDMTLGTWAFQVADTATGEKMLTQIEALYTGVAFRPADGVTRDKVSVLVLAPQPGQPGLTVYRAHYLGEEDRVVRVEAYGPDAATAKSAFVTLLDDQLEQLPPG